MVLKILLASSFLTLAKSVVAGGDCDQSNGDCGLVLDGAITSHLECQYKVTRSQMLKVNKPALLQVEIGEQCPRDEKGWLHDDACRKCADHYIPCQGQFTACSGCCAVEVPITHHRCRDVKDYFKMENWCNLSLDTASTEDDNGDPDVKFKVDDKMDDDFHSGTLVDGCDVDKNRVKCDKVPAVVDFNCNPCNKGSPLLMKKCCDECAKFSRSEKLANLSGIRAFVTCQGCETTTINMPKGSPMSWKYAGQYKEYSRDSAAYNMDEWIEDNICTLFAPSSPKCKRRLLDRNQTSDLAAECNTTTTTTTTTTTVNTATTAATAPTTAATMATTAAATTTAVATATTAATTATTAAATATTAAATATTAAADEVPLFAQDDVVSGADKARVENQTRVKIVSVSVSASAGLAVGSVLKLVMILQYFND